MALQTPSGQSTVCCSTFTRKTGLESLQFAVGQHLSQFTPVRATMTCPSMPRPGVPICAIHRRLTGATNAPSSTPAVSRAIQKRGRRFRPVYFVSARTSLPCRRLRSFFSRIQSRLFFTDLPLAFLNRVLSLVNFAWCISSLSADSVPRPFGNVPDAPTKRQRKNFLALALLG